METHIKYLTEKETCDLTGFAPSTLRNQRFQGKGLPYIKCGRAVRYSFQDVVDWMESHKIETSDSTESV